MEWIVSWSFWSDEERWFVPRRYGRGVSLNLKVVAKRLGWIRAPDETDGASQGAPGDEGTPTPKSREQRLRERIEASKTERRE